MAPEVDEGSKVTTTVDHREGDEASR